MNVLPLKSINFTADINTAIGYIEIELNYVNDFNYFIDTVFYFAISANACFDNFEALIGKDKRVTGLIKGIISFSF